MMLSIKKQYASIINADFLPFILAISLVQTAPNGPPNANIATAMLHLSVLCPGNTIFSGELIAPTFQPTKNCDMLAIKTAKPKETDNMCLSASNSSANFLSTLFLMLT